MRKQKTEIVIGTASASAEIAAFVAGSAGKIAVEQTVRAFRLPAAAVSMGRRALDSKALGRHLQEQGHEVSTEQALANFAVALIEEPGATEEHDRHFDVLVDKMKSVSDVSNGIRIGDSADPGVVHSRLETLREVTGMGPDDQAYVSEQAALARLVDGTRANVTSTL